MPKTYDPIQSTTLTTTTSTVTFSSIPSTFTDLILVCNGFLDTSAQEPRIQINNDTGNNYSQTTMTGNGSSALSTRVSNANIFYIAYGGPWSTTSTNRSTTIVQFMNYSNTTTNKTMISRHNRADSVVDAIVGLWRSTAAINEIDITAGAGSFAATTTFTLYGIKAA